MASPESNQQQQTWVPYESAKDCSQGFCSIYCPQWCYVIFPPPPPFSFVSDDDDSSGGTTFSPLVIAIIGILASAFLLVSYYTIISKYCGGFRRRRRSRGGEPLGPGDPAVDDDDGGGNQSHRHEMWHVSPTNGLDEALISKISVYKYRRGEGLIDGTDCSVCLNEFREDESLRLLPKCGHAFHLQCIDTWLRSHSNCPLCRANIVSVSPAPQAQLPAAPPPPPPPPPPPLLSSETVAEGERNDDETVVEVIEDLEEASTNSETDGGDSSKESSGWREANHHHHDIIEIRDDDDDEGAQQQLRRSLSMGSSNRGRVSIADILQLSMEDKFMVANDQGVSVGGGGGASLSRGRGEHSKGSGRSSRSLHCVMSPVPMKRSVSSGRFGLNRQGKGSSSVLPL